MPKGNLNTRNQVSAAVQVPKKRSLFLTLTLFFVGVIFLAACIATITAIFYPTLVPLTFFLASYGIVLGKLGLISIASISGVLGISAFLPSVYRFVKGHGPMEHSLNSAHENEVGAMQRPVIGQVDIPSAENATRFSTKQQSAIPMPSSSNTLEAEVHTASEEDKISTESTAEQKKTMTPSLDIPSSPQTEHTESNQQSTLEQSSSDAHFATSPSSPSMFHRLPNRSPSMNNGLEVSDRHEVKTDENISSSQDKQIHRSPSCGNR